MDREILLEVGRPDSEASWTWHWITDGRFRIKSKGLEYRSQFSYGERKIRFRLQGPKFKGGYGFRFQLEF